MEVEMWKRTVVTTCAVAWALALTGCGGASGSVASDGTGSEVATEASEETGALEAGKVAESISTDAGLGNLSFDTQEIWVDSEGGRIFGVAYVPQAERPLPLVVFAHELGNDHTAGTAYAEVLASHGYAVYTFDFRGGSVGGNQSDGSTTQMSVKTEEADLEAVVEAAKAWDFVDPDRVVVLGGSQGGCVSAVYAAEHPDEIAGLVLLYPALSIYDDLHASFDSLDQVSDTYGLFGGWITVGRIYAQDMWDYDPYQHIGAYTGKVLIMHGDKDSTVDVSYAERAAKTYPDCELHVIEGAGHGFTGAAFDEVCGHLLDYLEETVGTGDAQAQAADDATAQTLQIQVGSTTLTARLEDNSSATALATLLAEGPLTIDLHDYGNFEKVGPLPTELPRNDAQITTEPGDVILYQGDQITIYYDVNTWSFTRLAHIDGMSAQDLREVLGEGDVTVTLSLA